MEGLAVQTTIDGMIKIVMQLLRKLLEDVLRDQNFVDLERALADMRLEFKTFTTRTAKKLDCVAKRSLVHLKNPKK